MRPFLLYFKARLAQEAELLSYRVYVTDALKLATENTQRFAGGAAMSERWADALKPKDTRTGDEIAADVHMRAGLRQRGGGEHGT